MTEAEFLLLVVAALDAAGVPYMIVGSRGASLHGLSRTTQGVDIVIDPNAAQLESLYDSTMTFTSTDRRREARSLGGASSTSSI